MYSVSNAYLAAIKQPIQVHKVRGTIGSVAFTDENILDGSFSISNQSTDTSDIVLGSCYIGQLSATFTGLNISRTEWMNKVITPYFQLWFDDQNYEEVPLGVYTIKEVNHTAEGVEVVAYDNMYKFDKKFKKSGLNMVAKPYNFLIVFCQKCGIELGMNSTQVESLPNGNADLYLCGVRKSTTTYANDIETYRDALFWLAQCLGSFATMRRDGKLVLRAYKETVDDSISDIYRLSGAKFADYITSYTGIYTESLYDGEVTYYGYDLATLQQMRDTAMVQLEQIITDLAELEEEYAQGQITEEEYKAEKKRLTSEKKAKEKYISWLDKMIAQAQAEGDGAYMDLGANPFFQRRDANIPSIADATLATTLRSHILSALGKIEYTPFSCSSVFGVHYDLGDVIQFSGGHADDDLGCIMSYEWTLHGQYNMDGYGIDPDKQNVKDVKKKQSERAQKNALAASRNSTGTDFPVSPNDGDIHVVVNKITDEPLQEDQFTATSSETYPIYMEDFSGDNNNGYSFNVTGRPSTFGEGENAEFTLQGLTDGVQYHIEFDAQLTSGEWHSTAWKDTVSACGTSIDLKQYDYTVGHYDFDFTYADNGKLHFFFAEADYQYFTYSFSNMKITPVNGAIQGMEASVGGEWQNIDYVRTISQTQTSSGGEKIATANNSDGTTTDIYAKKVEANPSGSGMDELETIQIGDTIYELAAGGNDVGLSVGSNGAIQSTYTDGTEQTEDILSDDTGEDIATILDSIASEMRLLNQPEVYAPVVYSTEEREVGVAENGKPLYQKTIKSGLLAADSNTATGLTNIDTFHLISIKAIQSNGTQVAPLYISMYNYQGAGTYYGLIYLENNSLYYSNMSRTNQLYIEAVVQYTKTTDIAGSGHYAALGVPAVHYDDTERVIGTWFGKPLYEKVIDNLSATMSWNGAYRSEAIINYNASDIKCIVKAIGIKEDASEPQTFCLSVAITNNKSELNVYGISGDTINKLIIEYTKTTD